MTLKGEHHTEETKQKLHDIFVGRPTGRKRSDAFIKGTQTSADMRRGKPLSEEHKQKVSMALKGKMPKNIELLKLSQLDKPKSDEARKKMSDSKKKLFEDPERRKRQDHMAGKYHTENTKKKMSQTRKGHIVTQQMRDKIALSLTGRKRFNSMSPKGPLNHFWKGGISFAPYCEKFTKEFKERIRVYFNYQCVECGTHQSALKKSLAIHHVDFDKESCCSDTVPLFVPLCNKCHSKTNFNREYWKEHFTNMINTYYGGKCYLSKNEMSSMSPNGIIMVGV